MHGEQPENLLKLPFLRTFGELLGHRARVSNHTFGWKKKKLEKKKKKRHRLSRKVRANSQAPLGPAGSAPRNQA